MSTTNIPANQAVPDSDMLEVVTCKQCGRKEYYGMMHWLNGNTICRHCTSAVWAKMSTTETHLKFFPIYEDGIDYTTGGSTDA